MKVGSSNCSILLSPSPSFIQPRKDWKVGRWEATAVHMGPGETHPWDSGWGSHGYPPVLECLYSWRHQKKKKKIPHCLAPPPLLTKQRWNFSIPQSFCWHGAPNVPWYPVFFISCTSLLSHPCFWLLDHPFLIHLFRYWLSVSKAMPTNTNRPPWRQQQLI